MAEAVEIMTAPEVAALLRVHIRTVYKLAEQGKILGSKIGRSWRANEVRLQLSVLAYNLGNLWRRLVLPKRIDNWSLTSLQQRLVKTGGWAGI